MRTFATISTALGALTTLVRAADPTQFEADSRLHRSFWGFAYTSENSAQYPQCGDTIDEVVKDMQLLSQLTTRIRLYGTDCDQFKLVQEAIQSTQTNLHVYAGIYIDGNETTYARQKETAFEILDQYGTDNILGITVGNEYLLQAQSGGESVATAQAYLITKINDVRTTLEGKGYPKTIPVGTADAGSMITAALSAAADYVMANSHPFFSGVTIDGAAAWTAQYLIDEEPHFATDAGKTLYSAEIGWPTDAMDGGSLTLNGSIASLANTQTLLDTFVCTANDNITAGGPYSNGYFWFELFDEMWKTRYGGAEPYWGLFDKDRNLKDLTIPNCLAAAEEPYGSMGNNQGTGSSNGGSSSGGSTGGSTSGSNGNNGAGFASYSTSSTLVWAVASTLLAFIGGFSLL